VKKEEMLRNLCEQGILTPFKQPKNYSCYFIHLKTDIFTLDKLIDQAKLTYHYSIDTEGDALTHKPSTIQVEFIRPNLPPIMIIIEANYLPSINSPLFKKIQHLCSIIFTSNNTIYSWGSPKKELEDFVKFNLFDNEIQIIEIDVQDEVDSIDKCGLQNMIESTFKQYLDKTATLAEWSCGVDLYLDTYLPEHVVGDERTYRIRQEKKYRSILKEYAINDVFAVTKLIYHMKLIDLSTPPPTIEAEENDYEEQINMQQEPSIELKPPKTKLKVHVRDELPKLKEHKLNRNEDSIYEEKEETISIEIGLTPSDKNIGIFDFENISDDDQDEMDNNELQQSVHGQDEPIELELYDNEPLQNKKKRSLYDEDIELISDDEIDNQTLPEIMKIHRPFKQLCQHQPQQLNETKKVHVKDEPGKVRNSYYLGPQLYLNGNPTRNQVTNRRHRANRYRHEIIRDVYRAFTPKHIKEILRAMNILVTNVNKNKRGDIVYIGIKNEEQADEAEKLLHGRMFTEDHYYHYMKKKKKNQSVRN
jgi:hypothetical protein